MLSLSVADTGPGIPDPGSAYVRRDVAVGPANTRERLQVLHGEAHTLSVAGVQPHGLKVEICIPLERREQ